MRANLRWAVAFAGGVLAVSACLPVSRLRAQAEGPITAPSTQAVPANAPQTGAHGANMSLAGTWKINKDQSDDPRTKLQQAMGNGGNRGGRTGGGRTGRGCTGGQVGGPGGGRGQGAGMMDMTDFNQLTIEQSASTAKVTGATGRVLALYTSAPQSDAKASDPNSYTPPAAQWQGDQLVTVTQAPRGNAKTTRAHALSPDGKHLYVSTTLDNQSFSQPVTIRFVCDSAKGASN
jgi:hypothetical protein